jgi:hypothetical protein
VLCGDEILPDAREHGTFEAWMSATRKVNFDRIADKLIASLKQATDGEALEVLVIIHDAVVPQRGA